MPVYRENARVYNTAPSYRALTDLNVATPFVHDDTRYRVARLAAPTLAALSNDLITVLRYFPQGAAAVNSADTRDLVLLLKYLRYVVLEAVWHGRNARLHRKAPPKPLTALDTQFNDQVNQLSQNIITAEAHVTATATAVLINQPNYWQQVNGWQDMTGPPQAQVNGIPVLGTAELLCRIMAEGCTTMIDFDARVVGTPGPHPIAGPGPVPGLSIRALPNAPAHYPVWMHSRHSLPETIFLCCGRNAGHPAAASTFVITSSGDNWNGYGPVHSWTTTTRTFRVQTAPVTPAARAVPALSRAVKAIYDADCAADCAAARAAAAANVPPLSRAATEAAVRVAAEGARNRSRTNWAAAAPANQSQRVNEQCRPMRCPAFQPKARCLRCQALFNYGVRPEVLPLETRLKRKEKSGVTSGWFCAETIADHYCRNACAASGFAPANH